MKPSELARNLELIRRRIAAAEHNSGRQPGAVRLVAVTKGHSAEAMRALIDLGVTDLGESYLDEALPKRMALGEQPSVKWHMIGHVQSRKAQNVAANFDMLHSVDSLKLAQRLDRFASGRLQPLAVLLECNVSSEASKYGWAAADRAALLGDAAEIAELGNLRLRGLMSMAPYAAAGEAARPYFAQTRALRDELAADLGVELPELSMGMSGDFEAAIAEGATLVRIGTALLGERS